MIKLAVDCYGGDRGPSIVVEAAVKACNENPNLGIVLVGLEEELNTLLEKYNYNKEQISIHPAMSVISCEEKPTQAVKSKTDSSLVQAFQLVKDEVCEGIVSCGSTGAILAASILKMGRIKGVKRPAFCPLMPTMNKSVVAVCDSGANVDTDPINLHQFAVMGNLYLKKAYDIEAPRVALLNIGTEEEKGDARSKEAYQLLKNEPLINFVGNMESRDLLTGSYDLVVCDGFSGNVLIKSTEGTALELLKLLKTTFTSSLKNKIGALFLKKSIYGIKDFMDYNNYPGAVLLGSKKIIVKSHGSSKIQAVYESIKLAWKLADRKLIEEISQAFSHDEQ